MTETEPTTATATPAERLTAAADLLGKRARAAHEGPWRAKGYDIVAPHGEDVVVMSAVDGSEADIAYSATMHPEAGEALASLLRASADAEWSVCERALALADLLLAGEA